MEYNINVLWDDEAFVWVATSEDIPGLVLESGSFDALIEHINNSVPELIMLNNLPAINCLVVHVEWHQKVSQK